MALALLSAFSPFCLAQRPARRSVIGPPPRTRRALRQVAARRVAAPSPAPALGPRWHQPLSWGVVSSGFGRRWGRAHQGVDIAGRLRQPVYAAADGRVLYAGRKRGYGNVVILRHDARTTTLYAHNAANQVRPGQRVRAGQRIALMGSTGHATGPHLHFELRRWGRPTDPRPLLARAAL